MRQVSEKTLSTELKILGVLVRHGPNSMTRCRQAGWVLVGKIPTEKDKRDDR